MRTTSCLDQLNFRFPSPPLYLGCYAAAAATTVAAIFLSCLYAIDSALPSFEQIETVLPAEDGTSVAYYVYRVFSVAISRGRHHLGDVWEGSLPYLILLCGGDHFDNRNSILRRQHRGSSIQRSNLRAIGGAGNGVGERPLRSILRKRAKRILTTRRSATLSAAMRGTSANRRETSGESVEGGNERLVSTGRGNSAESSSADALELTPVWHINPNYALSTAGHGMNTIAESADVAATRAASTAQRIAAISTAAGGRNTGNMLAGGIGYGGGEGTCGPDVTKQPRIRVKVTLLCEHGVLFRLDDLHRLRNIDSDQEVDATLELALKLPGKGGKYGNASVEGRAGEGIGMLLTPGKGANRRSKERFGSNVSDAVLGDVVPQSAEGDVGGGLSCPSVDSGLSVTFDVEHISSEEILGTEDSLSMKAAFGIEGRYYNPRVHRSEHFIEPWR